LEIEPDNSYAKKGLAWIAYSNDNNAEEANRILDSLIVVHDIPDYYLLKAEIAESEGQAEKAKKLLALAQLKNGQLEQAKTTIETYVIDKTHEPTAALTVAEVYNALGEEQLAETYYSSIADARYELGPVTFSTIPLKKS